MKTIQLREDKDLTYYLTSISERQKEKLFEIKLKHKNNQEEQERLFEELSTKWGIWCSGILKIGEVATTRSGALALYIEFFKGKDIEGKGHVGWNREIHYRNYKVPIEKQKETSWLVNQCTERSSSVRSALSMMNQKWCILWELENDSRLKRTMDKRLKDKICYIRVY